MTQHKACFGSNLVSQLARLNKAFPTTDTAIDRACTIATWLPSSHYSCNIIANHYRAGSS